MPLAQAQGLWERQAIPFYQPTCHPLVLAPECVAKRSGPVFSRSSISGAQPFGWKQCGELKDKLQLDRVDFRFMIGVVAGLLHYLLPMCVERALALKAGIRREVESPS